MSDPIRETTAGDRFPILVSGARNRPRPTIPWAAIAPHERQAMRNHGGQSLRRLAERGGLSWTEALAVLTDREFPWRQKHDPEADRLRVLSLCGEPVDV